MQTIYEFRFEEWVRRAKDFVESLAQRVPGEVQTEVSIDPPLSGSAVDGLSKELGRPIPTALRAFFANGSGSMVFIYQWAAVDSRAAAFKSIYGLKDYFCGGGVLCRAAEIPRWVRDCKELAEDPHSWLAEFPDDLSFWAHSFPIVRMDTGDYLALDCRSPGDDPPVVYLSHDDESKIIAPSFTAFLTQWEQLHYVGPDITFLREHLDDNGFLSSQTQNGRHLKGTFGDVD